MILQGIRLPKPAHEQDGRILLLRIPTYKSPLPGVPLIRWELACSQIQWYLIHKHQVIPACNTTTTTKHHSLCLSPPFLPHQLPRQWQPAAQPSQNCPQRPTICCDKDAVESPTDYYLASNYQHMFLVLAVMVTGKEQRIAKNRQQEKSPLMQCSAWGQKYPHVYLGNTILLLASAKTFCLPSREKHFYLLKESILVAAFVDLILQNCMCYLHATVMTN